ncbi:MAG: TMEM175 family protein [Candidatus Margulisbacteria bacterium]|nr:TMEM175 family protein [Candidatus Margulisiibacteriota bacterium]
MSETDQPKSPNMDPHRLESLTDGIFAFAMTLLVLSINLPDVNKGVNIGAYLLAQYQNFYNFALSFLLLSIFWLNHSQQYHHIKRTDAVTLWLNIFMLLFVVLMPFSTSLMNDQTGDMAAALFFNANMLALSLILMLIWQYSLKKGLIDLGSNKEHIIQVSRRGFYTPVVALLALLLSFVVSGWSSLTYLLIPLALIMPWPKK